MSETSLVPSSHHEMQEIADTLSASKIGLPYSLIGKKAEIYMIVRAGAELGMPPMAALRSFHLIEAQNQPVIPRLSADAMVSVVYASQRARYIRCVEETPERCTWETVRVGCEDQAPERRSWSMVQQKAIGWKQYSNWDKYPIRMMHARAKSFLMRDVFPDVLGGMYSVEEMEDAALGAGVTVTGEPLSSGQVIDAVFTDSPAPSVSAPSAPALDVPEIGLIRNALDDAETGDDIGRIMAGVAPEIGDALRIPVLLRRIAVTWDARELARIKAELRAAPSEVKEACRAPFGEREIELKKRAPPAPAPPAAEVPNG